MKIKILLGLSILLIILSCESKTRKKEKQSSPKEKKQLIFHQKEKLIYTPQLDSLAKKEKKLEKFIQNLQDSVYTLELLKDKTQQNISYVHPLSFIRTHSVLDTAAIKSRFVLTEIHLKKINYLIQKEKINKKNIEKMLDQIVKDMNFIIKQIKFYNHSTDEFKEILQYDSIQHDSFISVNKRKKIPQRVIQNIKKIKLIKRPKNE